MIDKDKMLEELYESAVARLDSLPDDELQVEMQKLRESNKVLKELLVLAKETKNAPR